MSVRGYDRTSILLHWLLGLAILGQFALGWWMVDLPREPAAARAWWFELHQSVGVTLLAFVVLRLLWRLSHPAPELPGTLPRLQRTMARASHWALYGCMLVMPISGYLGSSSATEPVRYFGARLSHFQWNSPALQDVMGSLHSITAWLLGALVALHIGAALYHLVRRDGVFARMLGSVEGG
jgi:cytochrome b561